ncbi:MAG: YceI family protein [Pseudomonadota bacterium]
MKHALVTAAFATLIAGPALADGWTLAPDASQIAFASIKNDYIGEVHTFETLSGTVSDAGVAEIEIDLTSVETLIDIRNERMIEHVFNMIPTARLTAELDLASAEDLAVGEMMTQEVTAVLSFVGSELDITTDMVVVRLADDRVMAQSDSMAFIETDVAGIDEGINVMQELASLDMIARAVPVTVRLVFEAEAQN